MTTLDGERNTPATVWRQAGSLPVVTFPSQSLAG